LGASLSILPDGMGSSGAAMGQLNRFRIRTGGRRHILQTRGWHRERWEEGGRRKEINSRICTGQIDGC
jgi:hypothetical protein